MSTYLVLPEITPAMVFAIAIPILIVGAVLQLGAQITFFFGGKLLVTLAVVAFAFNIGGLRVTAFDALDRTRDRESEQQLKQAASELETGGSLNRSLSTAGRNIINAGVDLITTGTVVPSDGPIQLRPVG